MKKLLIQSFTSPEFPYKTYHYVTEALVQKECDVEFIESGVILFSGANRTECLEFIQSHKERL